jgi:hypothetical protein
VKLCPVLVLATVAPSPGASAFNDWVGALAGLVAVVLDAGGGTCEVAGPLAMAGEPVGAGLVACACSPVLAFRRN